jgi:peptidoglycan/LPS O-acetylase OafA/YrhL
MLSINLLYPMFNTSETRKEGKIQMSRLSSSTLSTNIKGVDAHLNRSFGLDLLRTSAILLVLISHYGHQNFDFLGFWGVELFFALSGFLIGQILWKSYSGANKWTGAQIFNFWSRRWWRTLPNYYLFFIIMLLTTLYNHNAIPSLPDLLKFIWFGQFLFSHNWGFYSISWSLCIEEWFYLLFPLVLFAVNKIIHNLKTSFITTLLIFFIVSIIIRKVLVSNEPSSYLRGITLARLDSIGYGVLVAFILSVYSIRAAIKNLFFFIGISLQLLTVVTLYFTSLDYIVHSQFFLVIVPLGFALMMPLMSTMMEPEKSFSVLTTSVKKISLWSYSIYLSHGPLMLLSYFLLSSYRDSFLGNFLSKTIAFFVCIGVSAVLFQYFELPLTKKRPAPIK